MTPLVPLAPSTASTEPLSEEPRVRYETNYGPGDGRAAYEPVEEAESDDALPADAPAGQVALHYATSPHTFFKRLVQHWVEVHGLVEN